MTEDILAISTTRCQIIFDISKVSIETWICLFSEVKLAAIYPQTP